MTTEAFADALAGAVRERAVSLTWLRERLIAVVGGWADAIAEAPTLLTAMAWLSLGPDIDEVPTVGGQVGSLRERIAEQYSAPFDAIFDSPDALEGLGRVDRTTAFALLIGPLVFGRISTLSEFDYRATAVAAVDGFLAVSARSSGSAGA